MSLVVKLYGGPAHGRTACVESYRRIEVVGMSWPVLAWHQVVARPIQRQYTCHSYYVEVFRETADEPRRHREVYVGLWEGHDLLPGERSELAADLSRVRWEVCPASILDDFDQWFTWRYYAHTGRLVWRNRPVDY